jgi:hypothetical protein
MWLLMWLQSRCNSSCRFVIAALWWCGASEQFSAGRCLLSPFQPKAPIMTSIESLLIEIDHIPAVE